MEPKVSYTLVGLFVVSLGAAFIAAALWLGTRGDQRIYDSYVAYMRESVSGLNKDAPVKYRGVAVGRVRQITLDRDNPERVRLLLDLEQGTPVKQDTRAILSTQGITGIAYVDLAGGTREAADLKPSAAQPIPEIRTGPSLLVRLDSAVSTLVQEMTLSAEHLRQVAERFSELLNDGNQQSIAHTLANLDRVSGTLATRVDSLGASLEDAAVVLRNSAQVSGELPGLVARVGDSVAGTQKAMGAINRAAAEVEQFVQEAQRAVLDNSGRTLAQAGGLVTELRTLTRTLQALGDEFQRDPNILLFGRGAPRPGPGEQ